jgi:hypothetical protein
MASVGKTDRRFLRLARPINPVFSSKVMETRPVRFLET